MRSPTASRSWKAACCNNSPARRICAKGRPICFDASLGGEPPMNVFESKVVNSDRVRFAIDGGPTFDFGDTDVPPSVRAAIGRREKVVIGVRPHAVRLGAGSDDARIVSNQWLGDQSHLAMEVAAKLMVAVSHAPIPAKVGER